jgi:hypothetical protein
VISTSSAKPKREAAAYRNAPIVEGEKIDGVPPPKNTLFSVLSRQLSDAA